MRKLKDMLYWLVDQVTLNHGIVRRINGFKIRFPAKWSRYFEKDYEKENIAFLKTHCKPGMTVMDVGSHLGLYSLIGAQLVGGKGKVYAFEPTPLTFELLEKNIHLNKAERVVEAYQQAVTSKDGSLDFYLAENEGSNSNSLVQKNHRRRQAVKIQATSIDSFVLKHQIKQVNLIKIDAEGSEYDVLLGAQTTLTQLRPKLILAMHPPLILNNQQSPSAIYKMIVQCKYQVYMQGDVLGENDFCSIQDFFDVHLIPIN